MCEAVNRGGFRGYVHCGSITVELLAFDRFVICVTGVLR